MSISHLLRRILQFPAFYTPVIGPRLRRLAAYERFVELGHYYSPLPSMAEVRSRDDAIFGSTPDSIAGVDLRANEQLALLRSFQPLAAAQPFAAKPTSDLRYHFDNLYFRRTDAIVLYCMLCHFRPRNLIEIGSGFSSALIVDTNERILDNSLKCTFIEPYPERLLSLIPQASSKSFVLQRTQLQNVPAEQFEHLEAGDFLIVDSSHVAKVGSDVSFLFFEILPRLKAGVLVHLHDVFYPFEYPREWIYGGRAWNEAYILRAFLQYNMAFELVFFTSYMQKVHRAAFDACFGISEVPGSSFWMRRGPARG